MNTTSSAISHPDVSQLHRKQKAAKIGSVGIPAAIIIAFLARNLAFSLVAWKYYPTCTLYEMTGYLCPGCGNTRAILSILHGHFLRAFAYNPTVPILLLVGLGFYGEMAYFAITEKHVHIVPRSWILFYVVLGLILAYDVLRNIFPVLTLCY